MVKPRIKLFRNPTKTPRDRRLDVAAAALLRGRGLRLTARRVRWIANSARPFMDDGRGRYEAVWMVGCLRLPRRLH